MAKIVKLLEAVKDLEIVVPEFQREYVWSLDQSKELMTSLFLDYPTGSILVWETNEPPEIKNNAVKSERIGWIKVLLDGQQRLTTLFLLINGEIPPYYTKKDITYDPRHLYFNLRTAEFEYFQKQKMKDNPFWKSVIDCYRSEFDAFTLIESLQIEDPQEKLQIGRTVNKNLSRLRAINEIEYYMQSVPQGVDIDKAIDIFDRVNSKGTKLTDAELVLTHIGGKWPHARRVMKEKIADYEKLGFYLELDFLTRCIVVILTKSALYKKMTDEVYQSITQEDYKNAWMQLVKILDYLIPILKQSAYISGSKDMSTNNVLIPIIGYLANNDCTFHGDYKNHYLYWMYLALIWARYSGQTDERLNRDVYIAINSAQPVKDLIDEIEDQRGRIEIKPSDLQGRGSGHPLYRMLYVLSKYKKAIDWSNGGSLQDTIGDYYSIHSHHIFPQAFLYKNGYDSENQLDKQKVNEIANRAFITRDSNYSISDNPPAEYLPKVVQDYKDALKQQFIPEESNLWTVENYEKFLENRRIKIADAINEFLDTLKGGKIEEENVDYTSIINQGENDYVEFKSSLRWDIELQQINKKLEFVIAKTIAAFLNSEGGQLFIGVSDEGNILGLDNDYKTVKGKDGFLLHLIQIINNYLGKEYNQFLNIKIINKDGKDFCVVNIESSQLPVFLKNEGHEEFFIRASASSQPLSISESNNYIRTHWNY